LKVEIHDEKRKVSTRKNEALGLRGKVIGQLKGGVCFPSIFVEAFAAQCVFETKSSAVLILN